MYRNAAICATVALLALSAGVQAREQKRCPAGETGCTLENAHQRIKERVDDGARSVLRNDNPNGRVREVKKTLDYCVQCGFDAINDGADRVSGKREGRGTK